MWYIEVNKYTGIKHHRLLQGRWLEIADIDVRIREIYFPDIYLHNKWPFVGMHNSILLDYSVFNVTQKDLIQFPLNGTIHCNEIIDNNCKQLYGHDNYFRIYINENGNGTIAGPDVFLDRFTIRKK